MFWVNFDFWLPDFSYQKLKSNYCHDRCGGRLTIMSKSKLSLEQQFNLHSFANEVEKMSGEQARDTLIQLYEQLLVKEQLYKDILKHQWNLD